MGVAKWVAAELGKLDCVLGLILIIVGVCVCVCLKWSPVCSEGVSTGFGGGG